MAKTVKITMTLPADYNFVSKVQGEYVFEPASAVAENWEHDVIVHIFEYGFQRAINDMANRLGAAATKDAKLKAGKDKLQSLREGVISLRGTHGSEPEINHHIRMVVAAHLSQKNAAKYKELSKPAEKTSFLWDIWEALKDDAIISAITEKAEARREAAEAARKAKKATVKEIGVSGL